MGDRARRNGLGGWQLLLFGQQTGLIQECEEFVFPENAVEDIRGEWSVEAFEVGPAAGFRATTVTVPLRGRIMASTGALNNSLTLP